MKQNTIHQLWKTVRMFFKKLIAGVPYDLAIPFLDIYPKHLADKGPYSQSYDFSRSHVQM